MTHHCESCGAMVTERFAKVLGDNTDTVHACLNCEDKIRIQQGAAAGLENRRVPGHGGITVE